MMNLTKVVRQLKEEGDRARRKQLDAALQVLGGIGGPRRRFRDVQTVTRKRRTLSSAARKRIAAAQRARWTKWRAARPRK